MIDMKPIAILLFSLIFANATEISPSRIATWNPGIPNGIPEVTSPQINVVEGYNAPTDSSADASVAIQQALDALSSTGGVVYLPQGAYRLDNQLKFNGDNIILKGAGADKTRLYSNFAGSSIFVGKYARGNWQNLESDILKGSQTITVADGSAFTVGEFAEVQQDNDSLLMYTDPNWIQSWAENAVGQIFEVTMIEGNQLTIKTPLHFNLRQDLNPQIRPQGLRTGCGIESLYIEKTHADGHTIEFKNVAYSWVQKVESAQTRRSHISINTGLSNEFRLNVFHHSWFYGGSGSAYGIEATFHSSDNLIEDNIFYHLRHAMMVHVGAVGNVFGYNFSFDAVQGESGDEGELNVGWIPPDISLHGHFAQYNLFEANVVEEIGIGDHWGPMGPGNTFLKNLVRREGIFVYDKSHKQNLVGNISTAWKDDGTSNETVFWNNIFADTIKSDPLFSENIPASYYRDNTPSFWTNRLTWPISTTDINDTLIIPAVLRWQNGTPFTTPTELGFNDKDPSQSDLSWSISGNTISIVNLPTTVKYLEVYSTSGRKISRHFVANHQKVEVDTELSAGIYWIQFAGTTFAIKVNLLLP